MSEKPVTCPICGYQFTPSQHPGCSQCPIHRKCLMICCPSCGYSILLPEQSAIVKWTSNLIHPKKPKETHE